MRGQAAAGVLGVRSAVIWAAAVAAAPRLLDALLALVEDDGEDDHQALDDHLPEPETPSSTRPSARTPITNAPMSVPRMVPRPPISDVPPRTTAAMAFSSNVSPVAGWAAELRGDDQADERRAETGDDVHAEFHRDPDAGQRAARSLPPIA